MSLCPSASPPLASASTLCPFSVFPYICACPPLASTSILCLFFPCFLAPVPTSLWQVYFFLPYFSDSMPKYLPPSGQHFHCIPYFIAFVPKCLVPQAALPFCALLNCFHAQMPAHLMPVLPFCALVQRLPAPVPAPSGQRVLTLCPFPVFPHPRKASRAAQNPNLHRKALYPCGNLHLH